MSSADGAKAGDDSQGDTSGTKDVDLTGQDKIGDTGRADLDPGTRPEGLADQFWNDDANEIRLPELIKSESEAKAQQSKLANEVKELRDLKGVPEKPESADKYLEAEGLFNEDGNLILPEAGTDRIRSIPADDPALGAFADIAHKNGLTEKQFLGVVGDFMTSMNPLLPEPLDEAAELASLGDGGKQLVQANRVWADGLLKAGEINKVGHGLAIAMGATAEGVKLINTFRGLSGEMPIPIGAVGDEGTEVTKAEWYAQTPGRDDPPAVWQEWEKQGEELWGTAPAGTSPAGMGMPRSRSGVSSSKTADTKS